MPTMKLGHYERSGILRNLTLQLNRIQYSIACPFSEKEIPLLLAEELIRKVLLLVELREEKRMVPSHFLTFFKFDFLSDLFYRSFFYMR